jgi:hypothetical protein
MASSAEETPQEGDLRALLLPLVLVLILLGFCTRTVVIEHGQAAAVGGATACSSRQTKDCLVRTSGVVDSADDYDLIVRYDDERKTVGLGSVGYDHPDEGTRVLLESWNGTFVSAVDPARDHRYRGSHWPKAWNGGAIFGDVVGAGLLFLVAVMAGDELIKRRRRASP